MRSLMTAMLTMTTTTTKLRVGFGRARGDFLLGFSARHKA
jgi:hypothetical protein